MMKRQGIKPCAGCSRGVMHDNGLSFYRVHIEHLVADLHAIREIAGMEMIMQGNAALAAALGPDSNIANVGAASGEILVCLDCAVNKPLAEIMELATAKQTEDG